MMIRFACIASLLLLGACTSCGANGGWERVFNPFCVGKIAPTPPASPGP